MAWHAKATGWGYTRESTEANDNCLMIYGQLSAAGWTLSAICGLLGSIEVEGIYNPWQWEGDVPLASTDPRIETSSSNGYGLIGFTPSGKYIHNQYAMASTYYAPNFSDVAGNPNDGASQIAFIDANGYGVQEDIVYFPSSYYPDISFSDYKQSNQDPRTLASVWMRNAERPYIDPSAPDPGFENRRREAAAYWYEVLSGVTPPDPPGPGPTPSVTTKMPLWFYLKKLF